MYPYISTLFQHGHQERTLGGSIWGSIFASWIEILGETRPTPRWRRRSMHLPHLMGVRQGDEHPHMHSMPDQWCVLYQQMEQNTSASMRSGPLVELAHRLALACMPSKDTQPLRRSTHSSDEPYKITTLRWNEGSKLSQAIKKKITEDMRAREASELRHRHSC